MAKLFIVKSTALGDYHQGSIISRDRLGDDDHVQRLLDLGAIEPAPEGSTPVNRTPWAGHAPYDRTEVGT